MKTNIAGFLAGLGFLFLSGCITSRQPVTQDASAFNQHIPAVYMMPVIDARKDKSGTLDAGDIQRISDLVKSKLEDRGYQAVVVDSRRKEATTSDEELTEMSDASLCRLAPEESVVFLAITINDVEDSYVGLMSSYSVTGTFSLIDRAKGTAIWKDTGTGSHGGGGIIGSAVVQADKRLEAQTALANVLSSLPENKK